MLSACASGRGKVTAGEGVLGLSQAFLTAGARRVGVALWEVQERPTSVLMEGFHRRYLGLGMEPAEALRAAQIEMWRREGFACPALWGGFQVVGDWDAGEPGGGE
jgi:CHAT domain-containing protein